MPEPVSTFTVSRSPLAPDPAADREIELAELLRREDELMSLALECEQTMLAAQEQRRLIGREVTAVRRRLAEIVWA